MNATPTETARSLTTPAGKWAAFLGPILLLLPFATKGYHIDGPAFVLVAQQIMRSPLDFFGTTMDLGGFKAPMVTVNHNPPGISYVMAFVNLFFGWREIPQHIALYLFAGVYGLCTYLLAARFGVRPGLVTAIAVLTPGFLVSASGVMTDAPMVALYVASVYLWISGCDRGSERRLLAASLVVFAASITKYYGLTLIPLLIAYTLMRGRGARSRILYLLIPVFLMAVFQWWTHHLYGVTNLFDATTTALGGQWRELESSLHRAFILPIFTGGCIVSVACFAPWILGRRALLAVPILLAVLTLPIIDGYAPIQLLMGESDPFEAWVWLQAAAFATAGVYVFLIAARWAWRKRDAEGVLLTLWIFGTAIFALLINHVINARVLLPMIPALAIVTAAQLPNALKKAPAYKAFIPVIPAAILAVWVTCADFQTATANRIAAASFAEKAKENPGTLRFSAAWGFQYYLEMAGYEQMTFFDNPDTGQGSPLIDQRDLFALAPTGMNNWEVGAPSGFEPIRILEFSNRLGVTAAHPRVPAGFYWHRQGMLPYYFGAIPPLEYGLYRWTAASSRPQQQ